MKKAILLLVTMFLLTGTSMAQSRAYSVKGGLTIGTQQWEGVDRDPLFSYHGAASIESVPEDNSFALFAQLGYHVKGSAWRNTFFTGPTGDISISSQKFKYENVALLLGFKRDFMTRGNSDIYYLMGIRGDYTIGTNLDEYELINEFNNAPVYPFDEAVRKWNYGVTVGAGIEFPLADYVGGILEISISPDFSDQYRQAAFSANVIRNGASQLQSFQERKIRNLTLEISVGFRFLHKIEYID